MSIEQLSLLAQIVGIIAVVATLIYLAIQTRQNTDAIRASSRHTAIANDLMIAQSMMDHPAAIWGIVKDDISADEKIQLETWLISLARTREHQWLQHRDNLLDTKSAESFLKGLTLNISFPRTRRWWNIVAYNYFDADFVDEVNRRLADMPVIETYVHPFDREPPAPSPERAERP
jgi:hypothetical protein